jgi:signal transduction histidine kinase
MGIAVALSVLFMLYAFGLGALVLWRNPKNSVNRWFAFFSYLISFWVFTNLAVDLSPSVEIAMFFNKLTILGPSLLAPSFLIFVVQFLEVKKLKNNFFKFLVFLPSVPIIIFLPTRYNIVSTVMDGGLVKTVVGPLYYFFALYFLITAIASYALLFWFYKKTRGVRHQQIKYIFIGSLITLLLGVFINLFLLLIGFSQFSSFGPISTVFILTITSYSIVKHRMMDIRMVVARSVAYATLLLILAGFYSSIIFLVQSFIFKASFAPGYIATQIVLATTMAFIFQPLRRWVTKVTDKIFFKNSYDKDELLSQLSHTLGSTIVLIEMLYRVSDILTTEMKVSRTLFALVKDENRLYTVQANGYKQTPDVDPLDLIHITKDGLIVADELPDSSRNKRLLRSYDAVVAIPLKTDKEIVGVLFLGEKNSGDMYSQQDLSILEILAPEISVAIENAKSYEEINRFNVTLRQEIKRATYRLKEKNSQLMELDKAKDEFISMASHQLRTPLTAIKGYLSMLLEGDAGDIKVSQYDFINEAYSGANRMVGLINDLLNVSRMETGRFFLEPKEIDIERLVDEEIKQLSNAAKNKGLFLKVEKKGKVPHIWADETKIRQVVMNFMDNAIYYTNTGGVTVHLHSDKTNFYYEVHDTGIGVPKTQRDQLFQKFFRADNARTARPDGTGLGIYLARRVIEDHGGEIIFDSTEGQGSVFGFKFPLKKKVSVTPASAPEPRPTALASKMPTANDVAADQNRE